jgi:Polyglycine hydrolase-like, structural repeat
MFEPQDPIPLTRHLLKSGSDNDPGTIQGMNAQAKSQGLILRWAAAYGDAGDPVFVAIWVPNSGNTHWNVDVIENSPPPFGYIYQDYFDAETSGWCRPAFVTLNTGDLYLPLFVDDMLIGHWYARHGLTPHDYQVEFDIWTRKRFFPVCVQAAGLDAGSARFAALFVTSEHRVAKAFSATGPVGDARIDAVIEQVMQESGVLCWLLGPSVLKIRSFLQRDFV